MQVSAVAMQVINMGRVLFLTGLLGLVPAGLAAQGRGGMPARSGAGAPSAVASGVIHPTSMAPARAVVHGPSSPGNHLIISRFPNGPVTLRHPTTTNGMHGSNHARAIGTVTRAGQVTVARRRGDVSEFSSGSNSVPGLGFDYVHVAATHPNAVNGRHLRDDRAVLFPFFDGGYFVSTGLTAIADAQGDAQQTDDAEDEENSAPADRRVPARTVDRAPVAPVLAPPAPQRDVAEYVFVRRDGTVFFAVAYSWEKGSLRYISSEGLRRSVARETLDLDATQQFNEQRGMTFRAPA